MWRTQLLVALAALVTAVTAQIPSLGWCPDYQPMANFDMNKFLGSWHEAERYFTLSEVGSRCVTTTYDKMPDGRVWVSNEIRNSFTGVKRVVEGQLQVVGRDGEGKLSVKYTSLPLPYDAQYSVLDTDYKNYAVMWQCNGIGPLHAQNAWVLTRDRLASGLILQRAYGVLDKYKISRAFFVRTNQEDCSIQPAPLEAIDPTTEEPKKTEEEVAAKEASEVVKAVPSENVVNKREHKPLEEPPKAALTVPELIKASADHVEGHVGPSEPEEPKEKPAIVEVEKKEEENKEEKKEEKKPEEKKKQEEPAVKKEAVPVVKSSPVEVEHQKPAPKVEKVEKQPVVKKVPVEEAIKDKVVKVKEPENHHKDVPRPPVESEKVH